MRTAHSVSWCFASLSLAAAAAAAMDLNESRFSQVINDVSIITPVTQTTAKATVNDLVRSPQLVRTGPASRAELIAQDQTLTRIGANTLFSFDPRGRTINLKQGSVLFHSPTGRGGGTIKTGGASAAVLGTTLLIVATPNGGFKGIVLEGKGKFTLPNGESRSLKAGQLLFVLPGSRAFGPTLNVNLGKMVEGSGLVKGYTSELPSMPKVQAAVAAQQVQITTGRMEDTGILVGNNASKERVAVIDPATFVAAVLENKTKVEKALNHDVDITGLTIPLSQVFPREKLSKGMPWADILSYALLAEDIKIAAGEVFIPPIGGGDPGEDNHPGVFGIIARDKLTLSGDIDFRPTPVAGQPDYTPPTLALGAGELKIADESTIRYLAQASLYLGADNDITLHDVQIGAQGSLRIQSNKGSIDHEGGALAAGHGEEDTLTVAAPKGSVSLRDMSLSGRTIRVSANGRLDIRNVNFMAPSGPYSQLLPSSITMEAGTLVLADIDLPLVPTTLRSPRGELAPNPNESAPIMNGYVNFYRNVTVNHHRAEDYVRSDANPNGNIRITTLSAPQSQSHP